MNCMFPNTNFISYDVVGGPAFPQYFMGSSTSPSARKKRKAQENSKIKNAELISTLHEPITEEPQLENINLDDTDSSPDFNPSNKHGLEEEEVDFEADQPQKKPRMASVTSTMLMPPSGMLHIPYIQKAHLTDENWSGRNLFSCPTRIHIWLMAHSTLCSH